MLVIIGILVAFVRLGHPSKLSVLAAGLVVGGALGNLVDRLHAAQVTDFIQVYYRQWSYPVFNVADCGITVGAVLLILFGLRSGKGAGDVR
jgi:signal peptidase II